MVLDYRTIFPRWMQEFRRFQALKSQFYLYGNVYDCYYFPTNFQEANSEAELKWAKFNDIRDLLKLYLKNEGYEITVYYDIIDGLTVEAAEPEIQRDLVKFLAQENPRMQNYFEGRDLNKIQANLGDTLSFMRFLVSNNRKLSAGIINYASRFSASPNALEEEERRHFLKLLKAAQDARMVKSRERKRNILIFICDKLNDIPSWVLLENPLTRGIEIRKPNKEERIRFFQVQFDKFYQAEAAAAEKSRLTQVFADLTDGLANQELENLITISAQEKIALPEVRQIIDLFKYGTRENFWQNLEKAKIENAETELRKRVLGQDRAVQQCVEVIRRARLGLHAIDQSGSKNKPKGVLFFAGPTGVGKTELAKSLADLIFSSEDAILRFDMSEYNDSNSDVKLIGAPPGYVGYEEGGQLTSQMKARPFSIVLFDEIEKAHPVVFDKFLQILDDGRLTDGKGETVYFSESLIIFTSNLGMYKQDELGRRIPNITIQDDYQAMSEKIMAEIRLFFNSKLNRPEILNRFGENFVVFDYIRPDIDREILLKSLGTIKANLLKAKNCRFEYDTSFVEDFRTFFIRNKLEHGGRGINNQVNKYIVNGITNFLYAQGEIDGLRFKVLVDSTGAPEVKFACIGA